MVHLIDPDAFLSFSVPPIGQYLYRDPYTCRPRHWSIGGRLASLQCKNADSICNSGASTRSNGHVLELTMAPEVGSAPKLHLHNSTRIFQTQSRRRGVQARWETALISRHRCSMYGCAYICTHTHNRNTSMNTTCRRRWLHMHVVDKQIGGSCGSTHGSLRPPGDSRLPWKPLYT
jgi:hypothetical protein